MAGDDNPSPLENKIKLVNTASKNTEIGNKVTHINSKSVTSLENMGNKTDIHNASRGEKDETDVFKPPFDVEKSDIVSKIRDRKHAKYQPNRSRGDSIITDVAIDPRSSLSLFDDKSPDNGSGFRTGSHNLDGLTINVFDRNSPAIKKQKSMKVSGTPSKTPRSMVGTNDLTIEEGTPAAEALRANAEVHVTKFGKFGRFMNAQIVRRIFKKRILQKGNYGSQRGKPPRVPSLRNQEGELEMGSVPRELNDLPEVNEEEENMSHFKKPADGASTLESEKDELSLHSNAYSLLGSKPRENVTFLDARGKTQELSLKKWKKKMKRKQKKNARKSYVKGKVIDRKHELYTLSIAVMLGLRTSIYLINDQLEDDKKNDRCWLESNDFMRVEKYVFRPTGGPKTPPHQLAHTFKFKDYSPLPFAYIRRMFGVNEYEFLQSVCLNANFIEFISNAKSGQFFFYSSDGKYMIKTMTNAESKFLRRILPHYFRHCAQNPNTLVPKFFGMYRVKLYHLRRNVKFVVMNSVFDTDKPLQSFFDLKGSELGREAKPGEDVKKDNDVRDNYPESAFVLPALIQQRLKLQVARDCNFLNEMKIMDYSMLIGVHHIPSKASGIRSGYVFRDSNRLASGRELIQKRLLKSNSSKPFFLKRGRNEGMFYASPSSSTPHLDDHSSLIKDFNDEEKRIGKKVEFIADDDMLGDHGLEIGYVKEESNPKPYHLSPPFSPIITGHSCDRSYSSSTIGYDDDDDYSYLEGAENKVNYRGKVGDGIDRDRQMMNSRREMATEKIYWPFHRHFEINGQRRTKALLGGYVEEEQDFTEVILKDESKQLRCLGDPSKHDPDIQSARLKWALPDFETPISDRKDRGLVMDVRGTDMPLKIPTGKSIQYCDGKIFYMGVIDVLQQFNVRKRMEARLRRWLGKNAEGASCVHPELYADRFIRFFEEYSQQQNKKEEDDGEEEVVFSYAA